MFNFEIYTYSTHKTYIRIIYIVVDQYNIKFEKITTTL